MEGCGDYTYSFSGLFPQHNPEIIIYTTVTKPKNPVKTGNYSTSEIVEKVLPAIASIYDISVVEKTDKVESTKSFMMNYVGLSKEAATMQKNKSSDSPIVILGDGEKIVKQYPEAGGSQQSYSTIYLLTDGAQVMPDFTGYSYRDIAIICDMLGIKLTTTGVGHSIEQSVAPNTELTGIKEVSIILQ